MPTASAPRAIALAASRPVLIPPDEMTGTLTALVTSTVLIAVGIPQSQNTSPRYLSSARYVSTAAQLVPPAPSMSIKSTPASTSIFADSPDIPQPVSFANIGISTLSVI